jgi:predicted nucleic acid-binding protein
MLGQFDLLIAAVARRHKLVLLTADADVDVVEGLRVRNWLKPGR